jgi:hypothetical protein
VSGLLYRLKTAAAGEGSADEDRGMSRGRRNGFRRPLISVFFTEASVFSFK